MFAGVANRLPGAQAVQLRRAAAPALVLALSLIVYVALRGILLSVANSSPADCLVLDLLVFVAACLTCGIRHDEIAPLLRPLLRGIGGVVLVQVAFDTVTLLYAPSSMVSGTNGLFFVCGAGIALVAGALALWRPSFVVPLFFHYVAFRHQLNVVHGVDLSETDYLSMLDVGEFVAIGALVTVTLTRPRFAERLLPAWLDAGWLKSAASSLILAWAIGAHLGNYFVSGWTKIRTGGADPLFWLLNNPTQTSILIGLERGDNPLAAWPWLVQLSWDTIVKAGVAVNLFVLATQIAAPLAILQRRVLMTFTLLFDLFHIVVYATLGAFFFFWIAVNILIYISAARIGDRELTPAMKLTTILAVLTAHFVFYTSHLGWLDGAKLASPSFLAETRDGRLVPLPSVYFGVLSYSIAQTAMYIPEDHFPMRLGGNTYNPADWRDAQSCGGQMRHQQDTGVSLEAVKDMVRETDAAMRRHPLVKNANLYYAYPNHMVANPLSFAAFNSLSIDDIARYHYIVESVCLGLQDGALVRDVRKRSDYVIDVQH